MKVVLDALLMQENLVNCHPLENTATITIASRDLVRFLEDTGHSPTIIVVSEEAVAAAR
ncbi:hypothetical protein ACUSIJ_10795 [Pseudochelatococcus sp. B33]